MSIVVFWLEGDSPCCERFAESELTAALALAETKRREGRAHVCLSTDFAAQVGPPGVASVEGGRTPDGEAYDWSKAGRAGRTRRR